MKMGAVAFATLLAAVAHAEVQVTFDEPERYSDAGRRAPERFKDLEEHFRKLGERYLAGGQSLRIEVLDIDLAGEPRYGARSEPNDLRVLKGKADWPSIRLRYVLESGGREIDRREETISDRAYLERPIRQPESLAYEKRMLERWFASRFGKDAQR